MPKKIRGGRRSKKSDKVDEPKPVTSVSVWKNAFTQLNVFLFIVASLLFALAIVEPSRGLDFIAIIVMLTVIGKMMIDGYSVYLKRC